MRHVWLAALLLTGCSQDLHLRQLAALNATIGLDEAALVRSVGVPTRMLETAGRRFLAYTDRRTDFVPALGGFGPFGSFGPYGAVPIPVQQTCETTYELLAGRVVSWARRGEACDSQVAGFGLPAPAAGP